MLTSLLLYQAIKESDKMFQGAGEKGMPTVTQLTLLLSMVSTDGGGWEPWQTAVQLILGLVGRQSSWLFLPSCKNA